MDRTRAKHEVRNIRANIKAIEREFYAVYTKSMNRKADLQESHVNANKAIEELHKKYDREK